MTHWMRRLIATGSSTEAPPEEVEEWFTPRTDGTYEGGPQAYRRLSFDARGGVRIHDTPAGGRPADDTTTRSTVYTGAGRFSIAEPFQRPVVFVVTATDPDGLTVRITDTALQETGEHHYHFVPTT